MSELFQLSPGGGPLLISVPHAGMRLPSAQATHMTVEARQLPDTDWFVDQVWGLAPELGAGMLVAHCSRYVVDLNRPPDDAALYAAGGTGLVPSETFDGRPIYVAGKVPDAAERQLRVDEFWRPWHAALEAELERIRERHGYAVLLDAHSIRSEVPRLFEGRLPDLNLGSFDAASAAPGLIRQAMAQLRRWPGCSSVLDGRFKGGYITRHYGRPGHGIHALQLEMAQSVYMRERPPEADPERMARTRRLARGLAEQLLSWSPADG